MRTALLVAVFLSTASVGFGQQRPDFSGEWVLDRQASVLTEESAAVQSGTLRIDHHDPAFRFARTFVVNSQPVEMLCYSHSPVEIVTVTRCSVASR